MHFQNVCAFPECLCIPRMSVRTHVECLCVLILSVRSQNVLYEDTSGDFCFDSLLGVKIRLFIDGCSVRSSQPAN